MKLPVASSPAGSSQRREKLLHLRREATKLIAPQTRGGKTVIQLMSALAPLLFHPAPRRRQRDVPHVPQPPPKRPRTTREGAPHGASSPQGRLEPPPSRRRTTAGPRPSLPIIAELAPHLTPLAINSVRPQTQVLYVEALLLLRGRLRVRTLPHCSSPDWDLMLMNVLQELYEDEYPLAVAQRLCSALLWALPYLGRPLRRALPHAHQALKGWHCMHPPGSRPPIPRRVAALIAKHMLERGSFEGALLVMTLFETYMRPSEAFNMLCSQVVPASPLGVGTLRSTALVVYPLEGERPGKTGEFDHTIPLDLPRQEWLGKCLAARGRRRPPLEPLFGISPDHFSKFFAQAVAAENLGALGSTPYGLRHGGASHDRVTLSRSLSDIQRRGNWRCASSMKRYEKAGRLGLQLQKLSAATLQQAQWAEDHVWELFERACGPLSRAARSVTGASSSRSSAGTATSAAH